jgi:spore maturation protein CgeB
LCFVSKVNGNQTAARSFEIPASGTSLLAMRTEQHMKCYVEGREAEFFGNHQELVQKARYYLEHDDKRKEIARRGNKRCVSSNYSWDRYMRDDWAKVLKAMGRESKNGACLDCYGSVAK